MPSARFVGGVVAGLLSAVLAARSVKAQVAAAALAALAPVTVAQLLRAVGAGLRDGDLVAVEGVALAARPLTSIDGSLAVLVRTLVQRLFTTVFDPRTKHTYPLGVRTRCADWALVEATRPDAIGTRDWGVVSSGAAAAPSAALPAAASVPVHGASEAVSVSAYFLSAGGRQDSSSGRGWLRKALNALTTWGRVEEGTRFTDSILPQGAPVTVVGSVKLDAGTNAVSLAPHGTVGIAVLSGLRTSPSDKAPGLKKLVAAFRASSEYRLMWSVVLGCLSMYLLLSGTRQPDERAAQRRARRERQRRDGDRRVPGGRTRVLFGAYAARMRVEHPDAAEAARLGLALNGGGGAGAAGGGADAHRDGTGAGAGSALDVTEAMAAADTEAAAGQDGDACVVCYERRRCCVFLECGHMVCCATCSLVLVRSRVQRKCPVCRKHIRRAVKVFDV